MTSRYTPGNRFALRVSIADAAVAWQRLSPELQTNVVLNDRGLPVLQGCADLLERAEGILIAANDGLISGFVHDEDGYPIAPAHMLLDRPSLAAWIADIEKKLGLENAKKLQQESSSTGKLLKFSEVYARLSISESNLKRLIKNGLFPTATHLGPNRWPESDVTEYLATKVIKRASTNSKGSNEDI